MFPPTRVHIQAVQNCKECNFFLLPVNRDDCLTIKTCSLLWINNYHIANKSSLNENDRNFLRTALFWSITQRGVAIGKARIATTCWIRARKIAVLICFAAEASNIAKVFCVEYMHSGTQNIKLGWGKFSKYTFAPDGVLCIFIISGAKFLLKNWKDLSYFLPALYAMMFHAFSD